MSSSVTGAHTIWVYLWEDDDAYNQEPGDITETSADAKIFGTNETMNAQDRENNPQRMFRPFNRASEDIIEQQFDGSWGADFVLTNSWWFQFFYGEPTVTEVVAGEEYEHYYEADPRTPPKSAHIIEETHYPGGTVEQVVYTGSVSGSIDVDVSVEDTVGVSLDGLYAQDWTFNSNEDTLPYGDDVEGLFGELGGQPETQYRAMHFGNSRLSWDLDEDGVAEFKALVQDAGVSFEGNVEGEYELGSRIVAIPSYLQFDPSVDYTSLVGVDNQDQERRNAYGDQAANTQQETMQDAEIVGDLEIDNGLDLGLQNPLVFNLEGGFPESMSRSNVGDPQETLEEDISRMVSEITVTVTSEQEEAA